jgi:hypothetical protein
MCNVGIFENNGNKSKFHYEELRVEFIQELFANMLFTILCLPMCYIKM